VLVERIAVNSVWSFLSGEDEDGAGFGGGGGCLSYSACEIWGFSFGWISGRTIVVHGMRRSMYDIRWAVDCKARPFLHRGAIDILLVMLEAGVLAELLLAWRAMSLRIQHIHQRSSRRWVHHEGYQSS